jgi:hypothetical protein
VGILFSAVPSLDARLPDGPVHRLIVAVDVEGSTERNNLAKGELRRILYELLGRALEAAGIDTRHLEPYTDRGDSVLILIQPHDEVPKTLVLGQLVPALAGLLAEYNASVTRPELRMRLRAVVHAGEVHEDGNGFYGDDLDVAFRLLEAPMLKRALKEAVAAPLILVVSEEIFHAIVEQGYLADALFQPLVRVRVGRRQRRGWVHFPVPRPPDRPEGSPRPKGQLSPALRAVGPVNGRGRDQPGNRGAVPGAPTLSAVYEALEQRLAETEEPYDVEAGLARLKEWMPAGQAELRC